ncbi:hypothetical protein NE604_06990 [Anaerofustis stercorihominis]|uniref:Anti-sigma factor RsgI-like middle domain-containing protein n=1 Tax=Anaerofustis stercorihominis DSM 17244 TaxID=445971 RepID=B1CAX9_9FIRM|nr:hypothetical protein [Anaerofustis stercorihominis]EDS71426.1 hypothetical protein ANASTE_01128 [Anaerofustis stercorihominis DSM 17244]MCQ4795378.1 hypothetical protein [Anaerofustis stercorihominis]
MNKYEEKLKNAIYQAPLLDPDELYEEAIIKMEEDDEITSDKKKFDFKKFFAPALSAVTCCLIIFVFWYSQNLMPYNLVDFDVNPSMEIVTNKKDKVIDIEVYNDDAKKIISSLDYKNQDIKVVVNMILDKMIENKYLVKGYDFMMLSSDNKRLEESKELLNSLDDDIYDYLSKYDIDSIILKQFYDDDKSAKEIAKNYNMSLGKYKLIQRIIKLSPNRDINKLKKYSVKKLIEIYYDLTDDDKDDIIEVKDKKKVKNVIKRDVPKNSSYKDDYDDKYDDRDDEKDDDSDDEKEERDDDDNKKKTVVNKNKNKSDDDDEDDEKDSNNEDDDEDEVEREEDD